MKEAREVMADFLDKLSTDQFQKETIPDEGSRMDEKFVREKFNSYSRLLKSGVIDAALE